jgi:shikimate kinase
MRIYLVGYMCSGKSKTGKALASAMRYAFADTDSMIEAKTGKTIERIFSEDGEEHFRVMEHKMLLETKSFNRAVIATGGGMPCFNDNMEWMNENGITVYMEANVGLLFHRLATSKGERPLLAKLTDLELMERITADLIIRTPIYKQAKIHVQAASMNVTSLQQKIGKLK